MLLPVWDRGVLQTHRIVRRDGQCSLIPSGKDMGRRQLVALASLGQGSPSDSQDSKKGWTYPLGNRTGVGISGQHSGIWEVMGLVQS